jgi:hypothetical protein
MISRWRRIAVLIAVVHAARRFTDLAGPSFRNRRP